MGYLGKRKGEDASGMPNIRKALPIIKWNEYFTQFLHRNVGKRKIPLSCVIHESDTVTGVAPKMARGKANSAEHGSMEKEIITR